MPIQIKTKVKFGFLIVFLSVVALIVTITVSLGQVNAAHESIIRISNDMKNIQNAETAHYRWTVGLSDYINYNKNFDGVLDLHNCVFGQYLHETDHSHDPEFQTFLKQVESLHDLLHNTAAEVITYEGSTSHQL